MLWLTGACGAIVFIEPSPYEVVSFLTLGIFVIGGLTLSPAVMPLAVLLVLINIGYSISGWTVIDDERVAMWLITSWYLALHRAVLCRHARRQHRGAAQRADAGLRDRRRDRVARRHHRLLPRHFRA